MTGTGWKFQILGELEVLRDGKRVPVTARKLQALLITLLLNDNRVVPISRIEQMLWDDQLPLSARNTIHTYVMRLRRALFDEVVIHTRPVGYAIEVDPERVDVHEFRELLAGADRAAHTGDAAGERAALTSALELWRATALAGTPEWLAVGGMRSLEEQRLGAWERRASLDVEAGRFHEAILDLRTVLRSHPLRDTGWELLISALRRAGRTAQALDAYREVRQIFRDELGVEPSERVQLLHQEILAADRLVDGAPTNSAGAVRVVPGQLPTIPRRFAGRMAEVRQLTDHLSTGSAPLVVVSGPPGVGKTALTLLVAHRIRARFPDGQLHVDLRGHSPDMPLTPREVLPRFLRALGVPPVQVPDDEEDQASLYRSLVADRRILVMLDNAASAAQVRPVLPGAQECGVVITSRDDLRGLAVDGARHLRLGPLDDAESRAVLTEVVGHERIAGEPAAVGELLTLCAGLPLALRIAGANVAANPGLRLADYAEDLRAHGALEQLRVPGDEQNAVAAVFDLSYVRLPVTVARPFRLLGLVPGPDFTAEVVAALMGSDLTTARRALDALVAANLVMTGAPGRYHLHDLIREYVAAKASEYVDVGAATERLWSCYLSFARAATGLLHPGLSRLPEHDTVAGVPPAEFATESAALDWLSNERLNLGAAVLTAACRGVPAYAGWLTDALRGYFWMQGNTAEILPICQAAETAARAVGERAAEASVIDLIGLVQFRASRFVTAREHHERALAVSRDCGDLLGQADSLQNLGRVNAQFEPPSSAQAYYRQALALAEQVGDLTSQAYSSAYIGICHISSAEFDEACTWKLRALRLSRQTNNFAVANRALVGLGHVEWFRGNLSGARSLYEEAIEMAECLGNHPIQAISRIALAEVLCDAGDYDQATVEVGRGIAVSVELGERRHRVSGMEVAATALFRSGQISEIESQYREALRIAREISFRYGEISTLVSLAAVYRYHDQPDAAIKLIDSALERMRETGHRGLEAHALVQLGLAHHEYGDHSRAAELAGAALVLARQRGSRLVEARALHLAALHDPGIQREAQDILGQTGAARLDVLPPARPGDARLVIPRPRQ